MKSKKVLIIGLVWPEPDSSAAGTRLIQLIKLLLSENYQITFASAAGKGPYSFALTSLGITEQVIRLNDPTFDTFLQHKKPDIVIYDRFVTEEQYGWRVTEHCPHALTILDTEDLHCLRQARQLAAKKQQTFTLEDIFSNPLTGREIASILRCDLSLIISEIEMEILQHEFRIEKGLLCYLPFLEDAMQQKDTLSWKKYQERTGFMFIGNYLHEPNWHTLQILKTKIWPSLSKLIPGASMHIYGAYSSPKVMQLQNTRDRFFVHGRAEDALKTISSHRIMLAPIQFGAGLKGKLIQAMQTGTPSVTTSLGAEGMAGSLPWNGFISDEPEEFSRIAANLYTDQELWMKAQQHGITILNERFEKLKESRPFISRIAEISADLQKHRQYHYLGSILKSQQMNSTKYMSLWIEQKNTSSRSD